MSPLTSASGVLCQCNQPVALNSGDVSQQVGVGRAGPLDNADPAQNRAPAARLVQPVSGSMRR
jgi:hypothetical protein